MKIIQTLPKVVILTPTEHLEQQLLLLELAGRTCYQSDSDLTRATAEAFVRRILASGHESVIEHSLVTVRISDCSRGLTHELVRHRLASFSQQSTRYVDESDLHFIMPLGVDPDAFIRVGADVYKSPGGMVLDIENYYNSLLARGWKKEDARQFLPIGVASEIVVSANFRQWRHIFKLRTSKRAHWEIRAAMTNLLDQLQGIVPVVFDDFTHVGVCSKGISIYAQVGTFEKETSDGS